MGKKKHAEHVNHERWLVSYADLLTLLFAFFVVLFASSVSDKKKSAQMAAAMQTAFTEHGVFDAHAATPPLESGAGNSQGTPAPLMQPVQVAAGTGGSDGHAAQQATERRMWEALRTSVAEGAASVRRDGERLTISLKDGGLFQSGTADLSPRMISLLAQIAASLPDRDLRVEGHTDNQPIRSERFRSNWELSTARAAAVAEVLMTSSHVMPSRFSLAGYGPFRPVAGNDTAAGRAENRRVDIVLLGPASGSQDTPRSAEQPASVNHKQTRAASKAARDLPSLPFAGAAPLSAPAQTGTHLWQQLASPADRLAAH